MKIFIASAIIAAMLSNGLIFYCLMRSGAQEDRWMEQHRPTADRTDDETGV
jgi:hypothetical protein